MILEDPIHPPTIRELMAHTAGFTYGSFGDTPVDKAYQDADLFASTSLKDFVDRLSRLPLLYQPGTQWVYSTVDGRAGLHRREALGPVAA